MSMNKRSEYVEREFQKWSEIYEIPFDQEFEVKALLELQGQYNEIPDKHIRTKTDILNAIHGIKGRLRLKKKVNLSNEEKLKVLVVVDHYSKIKEIVNIFARIINNEWIDYVKMYQGEATIQTKDAVIEFRPKNEMQIRGLKYDIYLNLTGDKQFENEVL
jgi:hypothetical protein